MPKLITTEIFIAKAKSMHGDKYIYDKSVYLGMKERVTITCPDHGDFEQQARHHVNGFGCPECSGNKKHTRQSFINKCNAVHGFSYDYHKVLYHSLKSKIIITCRKHGEFIQSAASHLSGRGCPSCAINNRALMKRVGIIDFISRSQSMHGDRYDYSKVKYTTMFDKITIGCKSHGDFRQTPHNHELGKGCPKCGHEENSRNRIKKASEEFIDRAISIHGNKYDYKKSKYKGNLKPLIITCKIHGDFNQKPSEHLSGSGCSACARYGFNTGKDGYVYFLISHRGIKIGITNNPSQRIKKLTQNTPFDFYLIAKVKTTGTEAMRKEKYYHRKYESAGLSGFDGATEWLKYSPELMSEIMNENPSA